MEEKHFEFEAVIKAANKGGAYIEFPYNIRELYGKGRVKAHATFDSQPYDGSIVNMGVKNPDGSTCYIIGILKDIRKKINKEIGDTVQVVIDVQI